MAVPKEKIKSLEERSRPYVIERKKSKSFKINTFN